MENRIQKEIDGTSLRCKLEREYNISIIEGKRISGTPHDRKYSLSKWKTIEDHRERYCKDKIANLKDQLSLAPTICKETTENQLAEKSETVIEFWSTRAKDGKKFGPHKVTIVPTENGCSVTHYKGHKSTVNSCDLWNTIEFTIQESDGYTSTQIWRFSNENGMILMNGSWSDSAKHKGSDKGKAL